MIKKETIRKNEGMKMNTQLINLGKKMKLNKAVHRGNRHTPFPPSDVQQKELGQGKQPAHWWWCGCAQW